MKTDRRCDPTLISLYYDNELDSVQCAELEAHLKGCASCQSALEDYQKVSQYFRNGWESGLTPNLEPVIIEKTRKTEEPVSRLIRLIVPAGLAAAVLLLLFSWVYEFRSKPDPSVIVSSVSGDVSSVMIVETPATQQTVLWIRENF